MLLNFAFERKSKFPLLGSSGVLRQNHWLFKPPSHYLNKCNDTVDMETADWNQITSHFNISTLKSSFWMICTWQHAHSEPLVQLECFAIGRPLGRKMNVVNN